MADQSFDEVVADAQAQIRALQDTERKLSNEIQSIRSQNPQAPLTDQEKTQLDDLRKAKDAVLDSIEIVALVTLEKLDKTAEVRSLVTRIRAARQNLQDTLDKIRKIGSIAQTVSSLLDGAGKLETKLAGIAKQLG